jgi:hypothetical protein
VNSHTDRTMNGQDKAQMQARELADDRVLDAQQTQQLVKSVVAETIADLWQGTDAIQVYLGVSGGMVDLQAEDTVHAAVIDAVAAVMSDLAVAETDDQRILNSIVLGALEGASLHKYQAIVRAEAQLEKLRSHIEDEKVQLRSQVRDTLERLTSRMPLQLPEGKAAQYLDSLYPKDEADFGASAYHVG